MMLTFGIEIDFKDSQVAASAVDASSAEPIRATKKVVFIKPLRAIEAVNPAESTEFRYKEIAMRIECDAVWCEHESFAPLRRGQLVRADALLGVRPDPGHDRTCLVEHRHAASEDRKSTRLNSSH